MNIVTIILWIIIILLLYYVYTKFLTSSTSLTASQVNLNNTNATLPFSNFKSGYSSQYSYGVWVYVNSWNTNNVKTIFSRNGAMSIGGNTYTDFTLQLDNVTPNLYCYLGLQGSSTPQKILVTPNFPIQAWTYVVISVDNQIVDAYINGKFVLSSKMPKMPVVSTSDIAMGDAGLPDIFLMGLTRWDYPMDPQTVWTTYLKGNGQSSSNFNMVVTTYQNNVEQSQFSLF